MQHRVWIVVFMVIWLVAPEGYMATMPGSFLFRARAEAYPSRTCPPGICDLHSWNSTLAVPPHLGLILP